MLDDVVGGLVGRSLGTRLRFVHIQRKARRADSGGDVRMRARAHPCDAPDWRYWRGTLVRRGGQTRWRPWIRRWRAFDLDGAEVVGSRTKRSAADGDLALLELDPIDKVDHLAVPLDRADVVTAILGPRGRSPGRRATCKAEVGS